MRKKKKENAYTLSAKLSIWPNTEYSIKIFNRMFGIHRMPLFGTTLNQDIPKDSSSSKIEFQKFSNSIFSSNEYWKNYKKLSSFFFISFLNFKIKDLLIFFISF